MTINTTCTKLSNNEKTQPLQKVFENNNSCEYIINKIRDNSQYLNDIVNGRTVLMYLFEFYLENKNYNNKILEEMLKYDCYLEATNDGQNILNLALIKYSFSKHYNQELMNKLVDRCMINKDVFKLSKNLKNDIFKTYINSPNYSRTIMLKLIHSIDYIKKNKVLDFIVSDKFDFDILFLLMEKDKNFYHKYGIEILTNVIEYNYTNPDFNKTKLITLLYKTKCWYSLPLQWFNKSVWKVALIRNDNIFEYDKDIQMNYLNYKNVNKLIKVINN
jgi:hypothetical protein